MFGDVGCSFFSFFKHGEFQGVFLWDVAAELSEFAESQTVCHATAVYETTRAGEGLALC